MLSYSIFNKICGKLVHRSNSRQQEYKEMTPVLEDDGSGESEQIADVSLEKASLIPYKFYHSPYQWLS